MNSDQNNYNRILGGNSNNTNNKKLECNKNDFEDFFKILENFNNKNLSKSNYKNNYNDEETNSVESDCLNELHDYSNNNYFNNNNSNNKNSWNINNNMQTLNLNNNSALNSLNQNMLNCDNNNNKNSNSACTFTNILGCSSSMRKNSFFKHYSQEQSDNSVESIYPCRDSGMKTKADPFNCLLHDNLIAYNNFNPTRRNTFNCLNNKANIFDCEVFRLSPNKTHLKHMQTRNSFIHPGYNNSIRAADCFNIDLITAANNFNNSFSSSEFCYDSKIPYQNNNNPMRDYYGNSSSSSRSEQNFINGNFHPGFYPMPPPENNLNLNMKNYMPNSHSNNANTPHNATSFQPINYSCNIKEQKKSNKIPKANNAFSYYSHNPNLTNNTNYALNNGKFNLTSTAISSNQNINSNCNNIKKNKNDNSRNNNKNNILFPSLKIQAQSIQSANQTNIRNNNNTSNQRKTKTVISNQSAESAQAEQNINHSLNINNNIVIEDAYLIENILVFLKDQNSCRLLQQKIGEKKYDLIMAFYEAVVKRPNFTDYVCDKFGNYVIQKFLEVIFKDKIIMTTFFENIQLKIFDVSVDLYGTRVFQKALDLLEKNYHCIENDTINEIFKNLVLEHMMQLIVDTNGNHVFMKVIGIYPKNKNEFIFNELLKKSKEIAQLKQGGTVFQKAFEQGSKSQKVKK